MMIEGPFRLAVLESTQGVGRELHLDFDEDFRACTFEEQAAEIRRYLSRLGKAILAEPESSAERPGMLLVQQVTEELLPHIAAGEIPLTETIVIHIGPDTPLGNLLQGDDTVN